MSAYVAFVWTLFFNANMCVSLKSLNEFMDKNCGSKTAMVWKKKYINITSNERIVTLYE